MLPEDCKWSLKLQIGGKDTLILSSEKEPFVDRDGQITLAARIMNAANVYMDSYLAVYHMSDEIYLKQIGLL
jgi:hypothetical protein